MSSPPTSELGTYRRLLDEKYAELDELLTDLPAEALLWRPFAVSPWKGEAGTLGWLIAHGMSSTVYLLKRAEWTMGRIEWDAVDGDQGREEFGPADRDPAHLVARAGRTSEYVHALLDSLSAADLEASLPHPRRPDRVFTVRYDLVHAIEHLSQHIGHAQLTRQLWALATAADMEV